MLILIQRKLEEAIRMSANVDHRENITWDIECHSIIIEGSVCQGGIIILSVYASNKKFSKNVKGKLINCQKHKVIPLLKWEISVVSTQ